jgi:hypothetical protein
MEDLEKAKSDADSALVSPSCLPQVAQTRDLSPYLPWKMGAGAE